ncbi:MAG: symporter [Mailhella sp.]|nr:symporter [Mailhella sp.]
MQRAASLLKQWTLPLAILAGMAGHSLFSRLAPLSVWLLMAMLFLTFSGLKPRELGFRRLHIFLIAIQLGGSLASWFALAPVSPLLAQSVSLCFFIPTATAAPTITGMLGGNVGFLTSYLFLGNLAVVLTAPLVVPLLAQESAGMPFFPFMLRVFFKVTPTLLLPLLLAWGLRWISPSLNAAVVKKSWISYYLWAAMILILISSTFHTLFSPGEKQLAMETGIAASSIAVSVTLFAIGKAAGKKYRLPIAAGQSLGQKNLLFGMWLVFQYLDPAVLISLTAYSIFQNLFNAWQIGKHDRGTGA